MNSQGIKRESDDATNGVKYSFYLYPCGLCTLTYMYTQRNSDADTNYC